MFVPYDSLRKNPTMTCSVQSHIVRNMMLNGNKIETWDAYTGKIMYFEKSLLSKCFSINNTPNNNNVNTFSPYSSTFSPARHREVKMDTVQ